MFTTSCPSGWTRVSAWDGLFLKGNSAYGGTGGSETHTHTVDFANKTVPQSLAAYSGIDMNPATTRVLAGHLKTHTHTLNPASSTTGNASSLPPYIDVVFCSKEDS